MSAGNRRSRVTFQRPTTTQNSSGEDVVTYPDLADAWVRIIALQGRELEIAQQTWAEARFRIIANHPLASYTLQRKDRIVWGDRTLDILDVEDPDQRRRRLVIHAKEFTE